MKKNFLSEDIWSHVIFYADSEYVTYFASKLNFDDGNWSIVTQFFTILLIFPLILEKIRFSKSYNNIKKIEPGTFEGSRPVFQNVMKHLILSLLTENVIDLQRCSYI
jgi:hypothetical protein